MDIYLDLAIAILGLVIMVLASLTLGKTNYLVSLLILVVGLAMVWWAVTEMAVKAIDPLAVIYYLI